MTVHIKYVPKTQFVTVQVASAPDIELPEVARTHEQMSARDTT